MEAPGQIEADTTSPPRAEDRQLTFYPRTSAERIGMQGQIERIIATPLRGGPLRYTCLLTLTRLGSVRPSNLAL